MFEAIEIQAVYSGEINTTVAIIGNAPPFVPGDLLTGITAYFASGTAEDTNATDIDIEIYACNQQPNSADAARSGVVVLSKVTLPAIFNIVSVSGFTGQFLLNVTIPFFRRFQLGETYLAIVASATGAIMQGAFFARLSRTIDE